VLTKRAERMQEYAGWRSMEPDIVGRYNRGQKVDGAGPIENHICGFTNRQWPLPNVWLGVTVENQPAANERIPILLGTPAAVRLVAGEPLLGPVDLNGTPAGQALGPCDECGHTRSNFDCESCAGIPSLDWVICGGESGPHARYMDPAWARSLRDQCETAGVPFFMKQMSGTTKHERENIPPDLMVREYPEVRE